MKEIEKIEKSLIEKLDSAESIDALEKIRVYALGKIILKVVPLLISEP